MRRYVPLLICLCLSAAASALAQSEAEIFLGVHDPGSEPAGTAFDKGVLTGFRLGRSFTPVIGVEGSYTFVGNLKDAGKGFSGSAHSLGANLLVQLPLRDTVPFVTVGLGGNFGDRQSALDIKGAFAWNVGGGIKFRHIFGPLGLRFDARYNQAPKGVDILGSLGSAIRSLKFSFAEVSGGLLITF